MLKIQPIYILRSVDSIEYGCSENRCVNVIMPILNNIIGNDCKTTTTIYYP